MLLGALQMFQNDLAIDLGTSNTIVFARGRGVVVNEPSIVAVNSRTDEIEAVGTEAREMLGKTPGTITAIRPMRDGVIADFGATERMLGHFIKKAHQRSFKRPRVVIAVPSEISEVERRAVHDSVSRAKVGEVHLVEEAMAAALGAGLPVADAAGTMIVDIGGGTTDIAVLALSGVVYSRTLRVAGNAMDEAIMHHVRREHSLLIGERTAERVKIELGSAAPFIEPRTMNVKGRHAAEGKPTTVVLKDGEIREALADAVRQVVTAVRDTLERIPPELSGDVCDRGITLCGGGALLNNLGMRLSKETGLPVQIAEDPFSSVVLGAGQMLSDGDMLKRMALVA